MPHKKDVRVPSRKVSRAMKAYTYTILIHPADAGEIGYWVEVPALPGCVSQGRTIEQCIERAREAIEGYLESLIKLGEPVPEEPRRDDASRLYCLHVCRSRSGSRSAFVAGAELF